MKKNKDFIECFIDFIADPHGLTLKEIEKELKGLGVKKNAIKRKIKEIKKNIKE